MIQGLGAAGTATLPFAIKRVLIMKGMASQDVRGGHTHHKTQQILFAVAGGCTVELDNGKEKTSVVLNAFNQGVVLLPYVWHSMKDFAEGTVLLVLADTEYDEKEYIRSYEEFRTCIDSQ